MDNLNLFSLKLFYKVTFCQHAYSIKCHFDDSTFGRQSDCISSLVDSLLCVQAGKVLETLYSCAGLPESWLFLYVNVISPKFSCSSPIALVEKQ